MIAEYYDLDTQKYQGTYKSPEVCVKFHSDGSATIWLNGYEYKSTPSIKVVSDTKDELVVYQARTFLDKHWTWITYHIKNNELKIDGVTIHNMPGVYENQKISYLYLAGLTDKDCIRVKKAYTTFDEVIKEQKQKKN